MGIEPGHRQPGSADPQPAEQLGGDAHHGLQALGRDPARDLLEGDVGRHVRHPQLRTHEQHRHLRAVAEVGQQLGVPSVRVSRPPHGRLVERRRGQGVDPARERRAGGGADSGHRQLATFGAHLAVRRRFDRLGRPPGRGPAPARRRRGVSSGSSASSTPRAATSRASAARVPNTTGRQCSYRPGSLSALSATSGPTPAGSPMVIATRGRVMRPPPAERAGRPPRTTRTS